MPGLPPGWQSDYDGKRWFYEYKASGHIQYHFPSEGDEFPDFVDALSPAPVLAPEERLESQQQVKRQGSTHTGRLKEIENDAERPRTLPWTDPIDNGQLRGFGWAGKMSASARPVSFVWDGGDNDGAHDKDADEAVFRPESFMFLGPGTYNDVSPLAEEEDETAKRVIAGDGHSKAVSPNPSTGTTPLVKNSELKSPPQSPLSTAQIAVAAAEKQDPPNAIEETHVQETPLIHMIDSREVPSELPGSEPWQDPVGRVPEMATGETPAAIIETDPEPVEIGEGREVSGPTKLVELSGVQHTEIPEVQRAKSPKAEEVAPKAPGTTNTTPRWDHVSDTIGQSVTINNATDVESIRTALPNKQSQDSKYQPYKPGGRPLPDYQRRRSDEMAAYQSSLQRERSLMMGQSAMGSQPLDKSTVPPALHVFDPSAKAVGSDPAQRLEQDISSKTPRDPSPFSERDCVSVEYPEDGVAKFPSVLRPARGRASSQPRSPENSQGDHEQVPWNLPQIGKPDPSHARHQSDTLPRKPLNGQPVAQVLPFEAYRESPDDVSSPTPESPAEPALAMPVSIVAMQRATSVMIRKAVPTRAAPVAVAQASRESQPPAPAFQVRTQEYTGSSSAQIQLSRERRHSSFNPSDVSPLASRSSSTSHAAPLESPSPIEAMGRRSSGISLAQSSSVTSFTPSPSSLTPGSERQSVISPLSGPSRRPGIPNSSSDISYFTQGATGNSSQQHRGTPSPSLQRSQSLRHTPSPGPSAPGHSLMSIEEHDEVVSMLDAQSLGSRSPGLSRRHSLANSPMPSPRPMEQPLTPQDLAKAPHIIQPYQQGPPNDAFIAAPLGNSHHPEHLQGPVPSFVQQPQNSHMHVLPRQGHSIQQPHPMNIVRGGQVPPQVHPSRHSDSRGNTGGSQIMAPTNLSPQLVSVSTAPTTSKEKDKKWTKWFKSSKSSSLSSNPTQPVQMPGPQTGLPPQQQETEQHMPWPVSHPIPQGPPPRSPQTPMPWSPNQIHSQLHRPQVNLPPQGRDHKGLPPPGPGHLRDRQPGLSGPHPGPPPPVMGQPAGQPQFFRQSLPPQPPPGLAFAEHQRVQRASGEYSVGRWSGTSEQWR